MAGHLPTGEEASGSKALETPTMELQDYVDSKKSKKRKRSSTAILANACHSSKLEKFYTRVMLSLTKPSYLLGLGFNFIRQENRTRLFHLLRKLVRQHNWTEAAGVLSVFLIATRKDKSPILNRFKYTVSMELLKHIEGDDVSLSAISGIYDTWMERIGTKLSKKETRMGKWKSLMQEHGYENHPLFNMMLGLISSQLWYSSIPEEIQWKDPFQFHPPTHSDMPATPAQPEMSATRISHEIGDTEGHNAVVNEERDASFHCNSESSVMQDKDISGEVDGSFHGEVLPVEVGKLHKENLPRDFQLQGFYMRSAESDASFDDNGGHMHFVPNLAAFVDKSILNLEKASLMFLKVLIILLPDDAADVGSVASWKWLWGRSKSSWLLPLQTGNWELDQFVHDEEYRNAVKYLQEAVNSTPPVSAALLPLIQGNVVAAFSYACIVPETIRFITVVFPLAGENIEALEELEKFCANSSFALPKRMKADLFDRLDPNNSVVLATCYEDTLKSDPKCSQSLARLVSLHQKGDYSLQSLLEMIALHLDAAFVEYDTWREFALCFLKVSQCEEDEMSVCQPGNEGEISKALEVSLQMVVDTSFRQEHPCIRYCHRVCQACLCKAASET
ncbi:unnamed protein product [Dovyalis caffra]|uniref:Uncharacterized protein n=1 Tax=Dovyalis caffra TaxID=77055 RepID=A0AAV1SH39_9ROSI|nr:unnamed protein product [Dovyalis caffra]